MGDWNAVLDPNLDRGAISAGTNTLDARYFRDFVQRLDLVDKFRERHPNKIAWTWTGRGASAQLYSYLDRVLVKRVDLDYLGGPSFDPYKDSDHKFLCVSIRLDMPLPRDHRVALERSLSKLLWRVRRPLVSRKVCCQRPREGGLGMPGLESHWLAERLAYQGRSLTKETV